MRFSSDNTNMFQETITLFSIIKGVSTSANVQTATNYTIPKDSLDNI